MKNKNANHSTQNLESRIWEMKEDKYTESLATNQVYAIFQMRDIRKKSSPEITEFIKLRMETPCWCPDTNMASG